MGELQKEWSNLARYDFDFWVEEWAKHGRCLHGMTLNKYFDTAVDILEQVGPLRQVLLEGSGMTKYGTNFLNPSFHYFFLASIYFIVLLFFFFVISGSVLKVASRSQVGWLPTSDSGTSRGLVG